MPHVVAQVAGNYQHVSKWVTPQPPLHVNGTRLKWYDLARRETPVPCDIHQLARDYLTFEAQTPDWELGNELGFVMLHRCGIAFYFLIVCTWRESNELWESVYFKANDSVPDFSVFPRELPHKGTYCVWEMGAVWHETQAWERFLRSSRDAGSQTTYLTALHSGAV